jgi:hypothetical protein
MPVKTYDDDRLYVYPNEIWSGTGQPWWNPLDLWTPYNWDSIETDPPWVYSTITEDGCFWHTYYHAKTYFHNEEGTKSHHIQVSVDSGKLKIKCVYKVDLVTTRELDQYIDLSAGYWKEFLVSSWLALPLETTPDPRHTYLTWNSIPYTEAMVFIDPPGIDVGIWFIKMVGYHPCFGAKPPWMLHNHFPKVTPFEGLCV